QSGVSSQTNYFVLEYLYSWSLTSSLTITESFASANNFSLAFNSTLFPPLDTFTMPDSTTTSVFPLMFFTLKEVPTTDICTSLMEIINGFSLPGVTLKKASPSKATCLVFPLNLDG